MHIIKTFQSALPIDPDVPCGAAGGFTISGVSMASESSELLATVARKSRHFLSAGKGGEVAFLTQPSNRQEATLAKLEI